uniref:Aspartyl/asparaginy/proline hydroxylase domain-containing protein n=1 Tax=Pinguiococcus pyrenoidosus TaxID=172671 RepID=A0A7R9UC58_9STRA|mmetsp:Transcript_2854/g.11620  ORF Transcript_2854/g.11620 Transcript_2854/m.11620 type:complete len:273 (+) Transcript_2854:3-821(+)
MCCHDSEQNATGDRKSRWPVSSPCAMASATIIQSALCRTTAKFRPSPSLFFFPGLRQQPVYDADELQRTSSGSWACFQWLQALKAGHEQIKGEYLRLQAAQVPSDYLVGEQEHQLHEGEWQWHSFMQKGVINKFFDMYCPATAAFLMGLQKDQQLMRSIPLSYAFFSTLKGGAKIAAHSAPANLRLRVHYPLIVPDGAGVADCGMRIGEQQLQWTEGQPLVFDDSFEHEVWNKTEQDRVVLLFDIWHPEITLPERAAIREMFAHAREQGWLK